MNCKNCQTNLPDQSTFCNYCGAKMIKERLTLKALFEHFSEQFLNYDNKFLQTFLNLFIKPEEVIGSYINGTRKKYVNVISYFAIAITISGLQMYILNKFFPNAFDFSSLEDINQAELQQKIAKFTSEYQSIISMLLVPLYAIVSSIVFYTKRKFNYTEHLVIFMYLSAQVSIFGAITVIILLMLGAELMTISTLSMPIYIIYSAYCLKRLFKLSLKGIFLRTSYFLLIAFTAFILVIILVLIIIALTGNFESMFKPL